MSNEFLSLCATGSIQSIEEALSQDNLLTLARDAENQNCLLLAVKEGNWKTALYLLRSQKVSPHQVNSSGNNIYNFIADGLLKKPPTNDDYQEIKQENYKMWEDDQVRETNRMLEYFEKNPEIYPPVKALIKKADDLQEEFFGDLDLFFPKYILQKYHVVLNRKNQAGESPAEYAAKLGLEKLARFYEEQADYHPTRRRMLQGLNDNLIRVIGRYL